MRRMFYKYEGAGNDFVIFDHRERFFDHKNVALIQEICDRRRGVGADGLILLENSASHDFKMVYFNSDGKESSMCGNGGRCIVAFAKHLGLISDKTEFEAIDGPHDATLLDNEEVTLKMSDIQSVEINDDHFVLNTGSPHFVKPTKTIEQDDIYSFGRTIRYSEKYKSEGINVNLFQLEQPHLIKVRTYERGVEDETLACGTGVTACAIASYIFQDINTQEFSTKVKTKGNDLLRVKFRFDGNKFFNVWLTGPATFVFSGYLNV
ncbi:MAG: diaminopimelate epimerase [Bacteroidota bacterium]